MQISSSDDPEIQNTFTDAQSEDYGGYMGDQQKSRLSRKIDGSERTERGKTDTSALVNCSKLIPNCQQC